MCFKELVNIRQGNAVFVACLICFIFCSFLLLLLLLLPLLLSLNPENFELSAKKKIQYKVNEYTYNIGPSSKLYYRVNTWPDS